MIALQLAFGHSEISDTLSLIVTTEFKTSKSLLFRKKFLSSFAKATAAWNKCNLPMSGKIVFNICKSNLVMPCITRRNSLYDSLQCLVKFEQHTLKDLCQKFHLPKPSESQVEFLCEYCIVLEPITMAIDKVKRKQLSFYGYEMPVL